MQVWCVFEGKRGAQVNADNGWTKYAETMKTRGCGWGNSVDMERSGNRRREESKVLASEQVDGAEG